MKKILPILLALLGTGAGVGAGVFLRPAPPEVAETDAQTTEEEVAKEPEKEETPVGEQREYVKLSNQFVIPLVEKGAVNALVVMSLSVEVVPGNRDAIFAREPKLRDSFLQVLFDHANIGGFRGAFTDANNLAVLRSALREVAQRDGGDIVTDVLILEVARQDV